LVDLVRGSRASVGAAPKLIDRDGLHLVGFRKYSLLRRRYHR
jgi:hypothetical protein